MDPEIIELILGWGFIIFIFIIPFVKKVPSNTVIIIDRNEHYLKTKTRGWYILFPSDKVTTKISTRPLTRTLTDYFETDDGKIVQATISCKYHAHNLDVVTDSLAKLRRSIDDIIKSSVHFAINNYTSEQLFISHKHEFVDNVKFNLNNEIVSIGAYLLDFNIYVYPSNTTGIACFRPHESSCFRGTPNYHSHDKSLMIGDKFRNGPIIYK